MTNVKEGWRGRFLEDFEVGDVYRCRYGRTITEADNIQFTLLTNNTHQVHFNREYGRETEWGQCLVNSLLTLSVATGMGVTDVSENGIALGWDSVRLTHPLFPGDTLYVENEVMNKRPSASRPDQGIVKVGTRGYNQHGDLVIEFVRSVLVWTRNTGPSSAQFPTPKGLRPGDRRSAKLGSRQRGGP
jgi:acyl dehydratase